MMKFQPHRIEIFFGFLATLFIAAGLLLYAFQEPVRIESAQAHQVTLDLEDAMTLYAENCAVCPREGCRGRRAPYDGEKAASPT